MKRFTQASLAADALMLGPHWVYNQSKLDRIYPDGISTVTDPASTFHPNRKAGEYTHYGDQVVLLDASIRKRGEFDQAGWRKDWLSGMASYSGYLDGATKETLASNGETASNSNDLAGASRIGPILDLELPLELAVSAARQQTALTHGDQGVIDSAEFFTRAVYAMREGASVEAAFEQAAAEGDYAALDAAGHLAGAKGAGDDFRKVSSSMGLTCHLPEAFPLTLFFALRMGNDLVAALSENGLAGGDTSARGMILAMLFAANPAVSLPDVFPQPEPVRETMHPGSNPVTIDGPQGALAGVLEMPESDPVAYALFAHCFTCGKDFLPEKRITQSLAKRGIATLRIDFSGLGKSAGTFQDSSFVTNLEDLVAAADWLRVVASAPSLLIGHSLGGAAVLSAAGRIPEVKGVVTIGAPADPGHVTHLFEKHLESIQTEGAAEVNLAGRSFTIGRQFLDDLETYNHEDALSKLRNIETLIMHAPTDAIVPLENAGMIYTALRHPKSFMALSGADHLLTRPQDAEYVASLIEAWSRHLVAD